MNYLIRNIASVLESFDWVVLGIYFLALIAVAVWVFLQKNKNTEDYFLAGRNVGWFVIGSALFASNIGSEHLVGLAGTGFDSGIAVAQFEILASLILLLLGWFFVPYYLNSKVSTTPEFLERRFSSAARWYLSIISIALTFTACVPAKKYQELLEKEKQCSEELEKYKNSALTNEGKAKDLQTKFDIASKEASALKKDTSDLGNKYRFYNDNQLYSL